MYRFSILVLLLLGVSACSTVSDKYTDTVSSKHVDNTSPAYKQAADDFYQKNCTGKDKWDYGCKSAARDLMRIAYQNQDYDKVMFWYPLSWSRSSGSGNDNCNSITLKLNEKTIDIPIEKMYLNAKLKKGIEVKPFEVNEAYGCQIESVFNKQYSAMKDSEFAEYAKEYTQLSKKFSSVEQGQVKNLLSIAAVHRQAHQRLATQGAQSNVGGTKENENLLKAKQLTLLHNAIEEAKAQGVPQKVLRNLEAYRDSERRSFQYDLESGR